MLNIKRTLLFLFICLGLRSALTYLSSILSSENLFYLGFLTLTLAIGFLYLFISKTRLNAGEAGGNTWWHNFRLVHGLLYLLFSIMAFMKNKNSWMILMADTILGFVLFLCYRVFNFNPFNLFIEIKNKNELT